MTLRCKIFLGTSVCLAALLPAAAFARTEVKPYLEVNQVVDAQLKGGSDVLTYTSAVAGVDASIEGERTNAQVSYRYEHRFGWGKKARDHDVHSALARVSHQIIRDTLSIEGGAIATRSRSDIRGSAPSLLTENRDNSSNVYSVYAGPTVTTHAGPIALNAGYRLGYTAVTANDYVPAAGQPRLGGYDHSTSHQATVSAGMAPGQLPFGWEISGAYSREDASQLDQRFETKGVRGDVTVPISSSVALLGGVGYEKIRASERAPLLDVAGDPVVDAKGRFVTDPTSPRLIGYDFGGIYWDVGVGWRPSQRTSLEAHVGRRYGSMSYTGSFTWAPSADSAFQLGVYDEVQTFGQQLNDGLAALPTRFNSNRNPLSNQFGGCVFSGGGSSAGGCFNPALQGVSSSVYRARGVAAQYAATHGAMSYGLGLGYSQRKYSVPTIPGANFALNGVKDETWYAQGNVGYKIDEYSTIDGTAYGTFSNSGIAGAPSVSSMGATGAYNRLLTRHLSATAALGLYSYKVDGQASQANGSALMGMRYSF